MLTSLIIVDAIKSFIIRIILNIVIGVYSVAKFVFEIFLILANGTVVDDINYSLVLNNFYIIIGVCMLFIIAFYLLKMMIDPDDSNKGTSTVRKIIINLITSSIIMALLPTIFTFMFDVQKAVVRDYNVIGRIFGYGGSVAPETCQGDDCEKCIGEQIKAGSYKIVNGVFTAFFNANIDSTDESSLNSVMVVQQSIEDDEGETNLYNTINDVDQTGKFRRYNAYVDKIRDDYIDFNWLLSIIAGCLLIYVGVSFCFDMAVRLVKLVFYQIIAPIPIYLRIVPEGKMSSVFNNWMKVTLSCYFEVYVRIFVCYIAIYLVNALLKTQFMTETVFCIGGLGGLLARAFVIMGIVTFMRRAPKLIAEVTGIDTSNMKLGIREKLAEGGAFTAGALVGGGLTAAARNAVAFAQRDENKWKKASGLGKAGMIARGFVSRSAIAGAASGAARGAWAGKGAKSVADMKKAAGTGAQGAVEARSKRAAYKAKHGGRLIIPEDGKNFTTGTVLGGHLRDAGYDIASWAGVSNVDNLVKENQLISQVTSERKAIDTAAMDLLTGDMEKRGKTSFSYDRMVQGVHSDTGLAFTQESLRSLKDKMEEAKMNGTAEEISLASQRYNGFLKAWSDGIVDLASKGATGWNDIGNTTTVTGASGRELQADLADVKQAADKYRTTLTQNLTAPFVQKLSESSRDEILNKDFDLTTKHEMMDAIKNEMKIEQTENARKINEFQQKEAERKENK